MLAAGDYLGCAQSSSSQRRRSQALQACDAARRDTPGGGSSDMSMSINVSRFSGGQPLPSQVRHGVPDAPRARPLQSLHLIRSIPSVIRPSSTSADYNVGSLCCCSASGSLMVDRPASSRVTRWRPRGNGIGSSKARFQPGSATGMPRRWSLIGRHLLADALLQRRLEP
jgi:hypothetical protein